MLTSRSPMPTIKVTDANPNWFPPNHSRNSRVSQGWLLSAGVKFNPLSMPPSLRGEGRCMWIMVDGGKMCNVGNIEIDTQRKKTFKLACSMLGKNFQTYYPSWWERFGDKSHGTFSLEKSPKQKKSDQATWMSRDGSCRKRLGSKWVISPQHTPVISR